MTYAGLQKASSSFVFPDMCVVRRGRIHPDALHERSRPALLFSIQPYYEYEQGNAMSRHGNRIPAVLPESPCTNQRCSSMLGTDHYQRLTLVHQANREARRKTSCDAINA
jgi:hypothetical protein